MSRGTLLITGANGFVGTHVAALAAEGGYEVWGIAREDDPSAAVAPHLSRYLAADLAETWPIEDAPDAIVHLAGLAAVGASFSEPQRYLTVNTAITTTMSEALLARGQRPRVVVVSTGAVYAAPLDGAALDEGDRLHAGSPYAVAKIAVETQAEYYRGRGLDTLVARPFNHIGPGQGPGFIVPDLTAALTALPAGETLTVGNLDSARDFTDVRDVARAYLALAFAETHRHDVYNVASGAAHSGREILAAVAAGLGREEPEVTVDAARLRPGDPPRIVGSADRLRDELGWRPTIEWRQSVADYIAHREDRP